MAPLHIVYIITQLELGGAQKVCLSLFHQVGATPSYSTALIAGAGGILDQTVGEDQRVQLLPTLHREVSGTGLWNELRTFVQLVRQLRIIRTQHPTVIVHTHSTKAGILGRWAAWCAGIQFRIHTIHGYAFHDHQSWIGWWLTYLIELITSCITTHFICVSSADVATGIRLFPRFAQKYSTIRAAVEWDSFHAARYDTSPTRTTRCFTPTTPCIIGTVACFKPQKNLFDLLAAINWLVQHGAPVRCEIIGDGALRPALERWIAEHDLTSYITLAGWRTDVPERMAQWHFFALTSLWEGLPCAVVEARILQLPVFSYQTGGIGDIISSGKNGMLYPQGAWQALAMGIYRCIEEPLWRITLATYPDALEPFHDATMVAEHCALYRRLGQPYS